MFFTYAYYFALMVVVSSVVLVGVYLATQNHQHVGFLNFELNEQGQCFFDDGSGYQLHTSSRLSFLGCWLILQPIQTVNVVPSTKSHRAMNSLFIFRDSLSSQDFSRIAKVLSQLDQQH